MLIILIVFSFSCFLGNQTFAVSLNKPEAVRASSTFENEKHSHLQTSPAFFASGKVGITMILYFYAYIC